MTKDRPLQKKSTRFGQTRSDVGTAKRFNPTGHGGGGPALYRPHRMGKTFTSGKARHDPPAPGGSGGPTEYKSHRFGTVRDISNAPHHKP